MLQYVYMRLILQLCGSSGPTGYPRQHHSYTTHKHVDPRLEEQAATFCEQSVKLDSSRCRVVLPKIMEWYSADFGGKESALLWLQGLLRPTRRAQLGEMFEQLQSDGVRAAAEASPPHEVSAFEAREDSKERVGGEGGGPGVERLGDALEFEPYKWDFRYII